MSILLTGAGIVAAAGGGGEAYSAPSLIAHEIKNSSATSYTFDNAAAHFNFGAADSNRRILACIVGRWTTGSDPVLGAVTIGGQAATQKVICGAVLSGAWEFATIYEISGGVGGSSGDVVVPFTSAPTRIGCFVYRVGGSVSGSSSPQTASGAVAASVSLTPVIPTSGHALTVMMTLLTPGTMTFTNSTQNDTMNLNGAAQAAFTSLRSVAGSTLITATPSTTCDMAMAALAYGP